jgi:hypothetical protein
MLQKTEVMELCHLSTWPLLESSSIFKPYTGTGLFKSKAAKLFLSFTLELQAESDQEFPKSYTSFSLRIGTATANGNAGKSRFRRATYDFLLQI